ncbi:hypothetical protein K4422_12465 [Enterococcus sp. SMC-9]|nr:hypothetical protein [Enterococcus sp. SMC-9]
MEVQINELSEKQLDELAQKIVVSIRKDREQEKKLFKKRAFHNAKLLMSNYHKLKAHSRAVEEHVEEVQGSFWEHKWLNLDILMQNKAKSVKLMKHVDICLKAYEQMCKSSNKPEDRRKWRIINKRYIDVPLLSEDKLAEQLHVDRSTVNRNCNEALTDLSVILFGIDMINDW